MALEINEATSGVLEADLVDEDEAAVPGSNLDSARMWITDAADDTVVNSRSNVDITSYIDESGHLAFPLTPSDTALSASRTKPEEWRNVRIVLVWDTTKGLTTRLMFKVKRVY